MGNYRFDIKRLTNLSIKIITVFSFLWVISCESEEDVYEIGDQWTSTDLNAYQIDTLTVNSYTIQLDSTITSGQSNLLIGRHNDPLFGKVQAASVFQINPESLEIDNEAIFDSISVLLRYDSYYYGDTLKDYTISVHKLNSRIKLDSETGYLYNTSTANYDNESIGEKTLKPRPNTENYYIRIPVLNSVGEDLFDYLQNEDVVDQENFVTYFNGLYLKSSENTDAVMRFPLEKTDSIVTNSGEVITNPVLRIYYHFINDDGGESDFSYLDFTLSSTYQFNQLNTDFTNTPLQNLSPDNPLPSESTGNRSFMQSGLGIFTRIEIPYVKSLFGISGDLKLLSSNMYLRPIINSYQYPYYLPSTLNYYMGNRQDNLISSFTDSSGEEIAIEPYVNNQFQEDNYYLVPMTTFMESEIESSVDNDYTLMIYPTTYPEQSFDRMTFGNTFSSESKLELFVNVLTY